jgi:membrane protease YdiL (CAAX protease family)
MKKIIWRLTLKLKRKSLMTQIIIFYVLSFLIVFSVIPFLILTDSIIGENNNGPDFELGIGSWILVVIIAPILETFLNQWLPFKLMQKWSLTKNKYGIYILISAIIFGLCHTYSLQYILFAFSVGLILGYTYFFYSKTPKLAFWITTLIHGLRNLTTFLIIASTNW